MISIIIPVYNVKPYLKQCIESVINQSYENLEIIIVNDGSTDGSGSICEAYSKLDNRIVLIRKENGGLSDARNVGTEHANGEFVYYVDSDDFLEFDAIEKLVLAQKNNGADIVFSNFYYSYNDKEEKANTNFNHLTIFNNRDAMQSLIAGNIETFAWGKLIRSEIAKKYKFPVKKLFEDHYWTHNIFFEANLVVFLPDPLVHYRQRENSISYTYDLKRLDMIDGWICRKEFLINKYPKLVEIHLKKCCKQYVEMSWLILTRLKLHKIEGLKKLRGYNTLFHFERYCDGQDKTLIKALDKNVYRYILLAMYFKMKNVLSKK